MLKGPLEQRRYNEIENQIASLNAAKGAGGPPTGPAGGNLTGTYPNPSVKELTGLAGIVTLDSGTTIKQTQGGTALAPLYEIPFSFQPVDPARPSFAFSLNGTANPFGGTNDYVAELGWNVNGIVATEPIFRDSWEDYYQTGAGAGSVALERHIQWSVPPNWLGLGGLATTGRLFTSQVFANGFSALGLNVTRGGYFFVAEQQGTASVPAGTEYIRAEAGNNGIVLKSEGTHALTLQNLDATKRTTIVFKDSTATVKASVGYFPAGVLYTQAINVLNSADDAVDIVIRPNTGTPMLVEGSSGNVQLFRAAAAKDFGSGVGVLGFANRTTAPTTNPAAGGVAYADAGSCVWRGSAGTTTAMAPA